MLIITLAMASAARVLGQLSGSEPSLHRCSGGPTPTGLRECCTRISGGACVLALAPDLAEAHMNLGLVYQIQKRPKDAMAEFLKTLKIKPSLVGANFLVGVNYCKERESAKAIPFLKAARRGEPNRADIWVWLATAQEMANLTHEQILTLKHGLKLQLKIPTSSTCWAGV